MFGDSHAIRSTTREAPNLVLWLLLRWLTVIIPPEEKSGDVIAGPASKYQHLMCTQKRFPTQRADIQMTFTLYLGFQYLRESLIAIIYVEF